MNAHATIGHNAPPSPIETAEGVKTAVAQWIEDNPVVQDHEGAKSAKLTIDRAKIALDEMDKERDRQVRPLNDKVRAINGEFKAAAAALASLQAVVKERLGAFLAAEEKRRQEAAEAARKAAAEAERLAREAEERERLAKEEAGAGIVAAGVADATAAADQQFAEFEKAQRAAAVAEREAHVKVGGGFGRAASLRTKETLVIEDAAMVLRIVGVTPKIEEALLTAARDFRRLVGNLPAGVRADVERVL